MKLGLKAILLVVILLSSSLSATAVTHSWYSDEEKATIGVSTAEVDVESIGDTIIYNRSQPNQVIAQLSFEDNVARIPTISKSDVQIIQASYWVKNKSTVDSFLTINTELVDFSLIKYEISVIDTDTGASLSPVDGWHYKITPGMTLYIELLMSAEPSSENAIISITNKTVLRDTEVQVISEFDLKRVISWGSIISEAGRYIRS